MPTLTAGDRQAVADDIMQRLSEATTTLPSGIESSHILSLVNVMDNKSDDAEVAVIAALPPGAAAWMTANKDILRRGLNLVADKRREEL